MMEPEETKKKKKKKRKKRRHQECEMEDDDLQRLADSCPFDYEENPLGWLEWMAQ